TAEPAGLAGLGLIDHELAPVHVKAVEGLDGLQALLVVWHFDKPEAARPSCLAVDHHRRTADLAVLAEQTRQLRIRGRVRQIPDVDVLHRTPSLCPGINNEPLNLGRRPGLSLRSMPISPSPGELAEFMRQEHVP